MAANINQIKRSALVYVKDIGEGAFSDVYQMKWDSPNGPIDVAAKKLHKKDTHELEILSELDHPNIVKLIGVVNENTDFMLILELCKNGSLRSYLKARDGRRLTGTHFFDWAEQVAKPLEYLRENKLVHKDIKSPNYLVTSQNTLKLGDFGIAKNIDQTIDDATTTASLRWMAPELLVKGVLSPKFDIFALAVVLWELWTGKYPWEGLQSLTILYKVCNENERLPIPEDCPEPIKDLLRQCWQTKWKQRPDITQVLKVIRTAATLEVSQTHINAGRWKMVKEFGRHQDGLGNLTWAYHMTLSPDRDVVIADPEASQIKIYSLRGELKSSIHTRRKAMQIAVSSDNTCFMTDWGQHITMYELNGKYKGSWESSCPDASSHVPSSPELYGLAIDHSDELLLGDVRNKYIYKYRQDGTHVASIKVGIKPKYIAVTSQGTIVIAAWRTAPQIISNTGEVLYTLKHPVNECEWNPWTACCHADIIYVSNGYNSNILCYSESGKYLGSMPLSHIYRCVGLAMTSDSKTLVACGFKSVKVFTTPSISE